MVLAEDLHDKERFDAIGNFDPSASMLSGDFANFGAALRILMGADHTPRELYLNTALLKETWRDLIKVVAALECLVRRLLLMLAAQDGTPLPFLRARKPQSAKRAPKQKPVKRFGRPEALAVRFAYAPPQPSTAKAQQRSRPDPDKIYVSAYGLAARLEALIRIYKDPKAAALRLRRRIARHPSRAIFAARMMAEPSGLNKDHAYLLNDIVEVEQEALAASHEIVRRSG